jgi:glutathione S-transferase
MLTLLYHPVCPHSLFVRLALRTYGLPVRQVVERIWQRREEFLILNPAGTTPVLVIEGQLPVPGASIIAEYLDEVYGGEIGRCRLLPHDTRERIEVRRLMYWFNNKFFDEVTGTIIAERHKQFMPFDAGEGSPDYHVIRAAAEKMPHHLAYLASLLEHDRDWLVGDWMTYGDLAAAAHLSVAGYLSDIHWTENGAVRPWYERVWSRPEFQTVLSENWCIAPQPKLDPSETRQYVSFLRIP